MQLSRVQVKSRPQPKVEEEKRGLPEPVRNVIRVILILFILYQATVLVVADIIRLPRGLWRGGPKTVLACLLYKSGMYGMAEELWREKFGLLYGGPFDDKYATEAMEYARYESTGLAYLDIGDYYYYYGRYDEAADIYAEALKKRTDFADAELCLALSYYMSGRNVEGRRTIEDFLQTKALRQKTFFGFLAALRALDKTDNLRFESEDALYVTLAYIYRSIAVIDEAAYADVIKNTDRAIGLNAGNADAYICKGVAYKNTRRLEEAKTMFARAAELEPNRADAYYRLNQVADARGDIEAQLINLQQAMRLSPDNPGYASDLGWLYEHKVGDYGAAKRSFEAAFNRDTYDHAVFHDYGEFLQRQKYFDDLLEAISIHRQTQHDCHYAENFYGAALAFKGRCDEAVAIFEKSLEEGNSHDSYYFREHARCLEKLDRRGEAIDVLYMALRMAPDEDSMYYLATQLRIAGRYGEALDVIKSLLRMNPDHSGARDLVPYLESNIEGGARPR